MAKRIVASCDNTEAHPDELVEAIEVVVAIDSTPRGLDLCPECLKELVAPLADLLADKGQPMREGYKPPKSPKSPPQKRLSAAPTRPVDAPEDPRGPKTPTQPVTRPTGGSYCPQPDCGWGPGLRTTLAGHTKRYHGDILSVLEGRYGQLNGDGTRTTLPHPCPVKGCDARVSDTVGLAQHKRWHNLT